jgi:putative DNA methylase
MGTSRKLIEVSLPLEVINQASVYEKFIRTGHPNNLHQWWSRKPLAAVRGVIFASLIDDPGEYLADEEKIREERERLFSIIEELVQWENIHNETVLDKARLELARSLARQLKQPLPIGKTAILEFIRRYAPPVWDPFAGGGSIPLEAQRLGLQAYASDLNPVAVLVNKAMIEIPGKFLGRRPIHPETVAKQGQSGLWSQKWDGIYGLLEDLSYYGNWVQQQAERRLMNLYPPAKIPDEKGGGQATVVAWLWVRTVRCPNPACGAEMPLASKWDLSHKKDKETWVQPVVDHSQAPPVIHYTIASGKGKPPERTVQRNGASCLACNTPVPLEYIRNEGIAKRIGIQMIAVAADKPGGRVYLAPDRDQISAALNLPPTWQPDQVITEGMAGNVSSYGYTTSAALFLPRQLVALDTLAELIGEVHAKVVSDAMQSGIKEDGVTLTKGGNQAQAYADAIVTYLAFAFSKTLNRSNAFVPWGVTVECPVNLFSRQTIPFIWDFAESNVIFGPSGSFSSMLNNTLRALEATALSIPTHGQAFQGNAAITGKELPSPMISTDPPYYDVIPYSDLSDFFYVWLRRLLGDIYPDLFSTMLTPKTDELIADANRAGGQEAARAHFERGMFAVFDHLRRTTHPDYPLTVYYAYKQQENVGDDQEVSTGWETILTGIVETGFTITGTWPMRTEREMKIASIDSNVLASSIVLVCRPRPDNAPVATRRDFIAGLQRELLNELGQLKQSNIAPVDLAQAAIGPGMAVFSRNRQVLEADGTPMTVRTALALINQVLDEFLNEQEGEYDADTRWALSWFEQYGFDPGPYGVAETLSKAKNTSINGLVQAGFLEARAGKVRLLAREEFPADWDPAQDKRLSTWEATQHLIRALDKGGEKEAATLLARLGSYKEAVRDLAYRLYTICERKKWSQEAIACNMLVVALPRLRDQVHQKTETAQQTLFS